MEKGILVFMNASILEHKKKDGLKKNQDVCYWKTSKFPKKIIWFNILTSDWEFLKGFKQFPLYVALRSNIIGQPAQVVGQFTVHHIHEPPTTSMHHEIEWWFYSDSWKEIKNGEYIKPSQGWRYYPKEQEVKPNSSHS